MTKLKSIDQLKQELAAAEKNRLIEVAYLSSLICVRFSMPETYDQQRELVKKLSVLKNYVNERFMGVVRVHHILCEYPRQVEMFIQHDYG